MVIRIINFELHDTVAGLSGRPLDHGERASKPRQRGGLEGTDGPRDQLEKMTAGCTFPSLLLSLVRMIVTYNM